MSFDWTKTLPFLGALATGGVPALVATAAAAIGEALGTTVAPNPDAIDTALKNATPDQLAALKSVDANLKIELRKADTEDRRIDADLSKAYIADTDAARHANASNVGVLRLGYAINFLSYALVGAVLYGCYQVLLNGFELKIDPGLAAAVGGLVGGIVQWSVSNSSQANGFFFGSSPSARQNSAEMNHAVASAITTAAKK